MPTRHVLFLLGNLTKSYGTMATALQERTMQIKLNTIREGKPVIMGEIMKRAGFKPSTSDTPKVLTDSKGWEELKARYLNDEKALLTLSDLSDRKNEDKDNRLKASIEVLKLGDRYPAMKSKVLGLFGSLEELE